MLFALTRLQAATFITFDVPDAFFTIGTSINPKGTITGNYFSGVDFNFDGFVRAPDGTITTFDFPGAVFTGPNGINPNWTITGFYSGAGAHGFVRIP